MNRFTRSIAMASARHPWRTIAAWVVVLGAVFALAGSGGGAFIDAFSAKGSQSERAMQLLEDKFPEATQAQALVVFAVDDGDTLQSQQQGIDAVLTKVAGADHVVDVADPFASGTISTDGRIGYATLTLDVTPAELGKGGFVPLTELVDASNTADLRVELGGDAVFLDAPDETSPLEGVGILIALLVLLVAFGTVVAAVVPIGLALVAVGAGIGGIFVLASIMGVSPSAIPIAGIVGLGVGIDYALFIVARYRENRSAGRDNGTALANAMSTSGAAVVFAGGTVVIAMASLAFTGLGALTSIGLATAIMVLSAVAAATTLLPASLHGCIGVSCWLEVRQEVAALAVAELHPLKALVDLAANAGPRQTAAGAEAAIVAKRAAAGGNAAVDVGASKAGIDADLLHADAEPLAKLEIRGEIGQFGDAPGWQQVIHRKRFG